MTVPRTPVPHTLDVSAAQRSMWFGQRLDPAGPAYNVGEYTEIHGPVDAVRFRAAIQQVVDATETLRVRFTAAVDEAATVRQIVDTAPAWDLPVVDLTGESDPRSAADAWMAADFAAPFDLDRSPLFRYALLKLAEDHWIWYQRYHHIAVDGYSCSLIASRVADAYTALLAGMPHIPPPAPLAPLLAVDEVYRAGERHASDRKFWMGTLADRPDPVSLSARPPHVAGHFLRRTGHLPQAAGDVVHAAAEHAGTRFSRVLLAATAAYLHRLTGARDIVLGLAVAARESETELATPGMASNVLPLRLSVRPDTAARDLVRQAASATRALLAHQRHRGEDLRRELELPQGGPRFFGPVVNIMAFGPELRFAGHATTRHNLSTGPVEDLAVNVYDRADGHGIRIDLDAGPAHYTDAELTAHHRRFARFVEHFAAAVVAGTPVGRAEVTLPEERTKARPAGPVASGGETTVPAVLAARAAADPHATAIIQDERATTYREMNERANRLAHRLIGLGVRPEDRVAVLMGRSDGLLTALLAVLKAGGAYVGLDPRAPAARTRRLLTETGANVLLTDTVPDEAYDAAVVIADADGPSLRDEPDTDPAVLLHPSQLAYVMFTSGSTGTPKGVGVTHRDIAALAADSGVRDGAARAGAAAFAGGLRRRHLRGVGAAAERRPSWSRTARGPWTPPPAPADRRDELTALWLTAGLFRLLAQERPDCFAGLRQVWTGGDVVPAAAVRRVLAACPGLTVVDGYGPTETTTFATSRAMTAPHAVARHGAHRPPAGRHARARPRRIACSRVPPGTAGELYLGRRGRGPRLPRPPGRDRRAVRRRPVRPARRPDVPHRRPRARDGPTASWSSSAAPTTRSRSAASASSPARSRRRSPPTPPSHRSRSWSARTGPATERLVAYVVRAGSAAPPTGLQMAAGSASGAEAAPDHDAALTRDAPPAAPTPEVLRDHLAALLPDFMVPSAVELLDRLPLTPNGKLDRAALPAPSPSAAARRDDSPRTPHEQVLCALFADVLGLPDVGPREGFFTLGGHSLLALRLVGRIRTTLGTELTLRDVFQSPTPTGLARLVAGADTAVRNAPRPTPRTVALRDVPLSSAQRRLWFLHRLEGPSAAYNIPLAVRLTGGRLDADALRTALADLVARHEILRTVYPDVDGLPCQRLLDPSRPDLQTIGSPHLDKRTDPSTQ